MTFFLSEEHSISALWRFKFQIRLRIKKVNKLLLLFNFEIWFLKIFFGFEMEFKIFIFCSCVWLLPIHDTVLRYHNILFSLRIHYNKNKNKKIKTYYHRNRWWNCFSYSNSFHDDFLFLYQNIQSNSNCFWAHKGHLPFNQLSFVISFSSYVICVNLIIINSFVLIFGNRI